MSALGLCGSMQTPAKVSGYSETQRAIRSFDTCAQATTVASSPTWGAIAEARGEKIVMSAPRSLIRRI